MQKSLLTNFDEIRNIEVGIACKQHKPQQDAELMGSCATLFRLYGLRNQLFASKLSVKIILYIYLFIYHQVINVLDAHT